MKYLIFVVFIAAATFAGSDSRQTTPVNLKQDLESFDPAKRIEALSVLGKIVEEKTDQSNSDQAAMLAAQTLLEPYKSNLIEGTTNKNIGVQGLSVYLLNFSKPDSQVFDALLALAKNPHHDIQGPALAGLSRMDGSANPEARKLIMSLLDFSNARLFRKASQVAASWKMEESLPMLLKALENDNPATVGDSADALGQMGKLALQSLPILQKKLDLIKDPQANEKIKSAIKRIQNPPQRQ